MITDINDAIAQGARHKPACETVSLSVRTYYRWVKQTGGDGRLEPTRGAPPNKFSDSERKSIIACANLSEYAALSPTQIVPKLADKGLYIGSESTFYRVLKDADQLTHRGKSRPKNPSPLPTTYIANGPNQVWSWDISYLSTPVVGQFYYLYLIMDVFSRYIVGAEVFESENGDDASELLQRSLLKQNAVGSDVVLHSDNGAPMKCWTMQKKMKDLGVLGSRSRPRVSNDNPYSEALFKTVKYCPDYPKQGFSDIETAREWVNEFVEGYNTQHQHSGIYYVTPHQRHHGEDEVILKNRKVIYEQAKAKNPLRWSGATRNWKFIKEVALNPDKIEQ